MWCIAAGLTGWLLVAGAASPSEPADRETVEVAKYDGSIQCQEGSGIPLSKMQRSLTDEGIEVVSSRRGHDCLMRTQVCGQTTGVINVYRIKKGQLDAAMSLGFRPASDFCK